MMSAAKKISFTALGLIALVLIVVGGFFGAMRLHFHTTAPKPNYPPAASGLDAQRQDIRYFRQLIAMDRSFPPAGRIEANRRIDALEAQGYGARSAPFPRVADADRCIGRQRSFPD
jgi:hypothetical protein